LGIWGNRSTKQKICHGRKAKQKQKICHGLTRKNTEKTEAETRKKAEAEAFATDEHGKTRKEAEE
jgi:hypothetical protein